jgi:hypothetical protein
MGTIKAVGLCAFIATGTGLIISSLINQSIPWVIVLVIVAAGYVLGLINHYEYLRAEEVKGK